MKAYEYHKDNLPQYIVAYGNEGHCNDDIARLAQELKDEDIEIIDLCTMAHLAARSDTAFVAPTGISTQDSPYPVFSREMLLDASLWHVDNDEWHEGIKGEAQAQDGLALTIARDATEADEGWVSFALENVRLPQETTRMGFRIANPENANRVFVRLYGEFADAEVFWMHLTPSYDWDEDTGGTGEWLLHDKICSAARAKKPVKINITAIGEPGKRVYIRDLYFR